MRRQPKQLVAQIPNMFTAGNILAGFFSIVNAFEGHLRAAAWLIIIGAFFDFMDGRIARFTRSCSEMGVQLDSLADFLTFGVAPSIFLLSVGVYDITQWKIVLPILFILAAAFRLARYNVNAEVDTKHDFQGMPSPLAALTVVSFFLFYKEVGFENVLFEYYTPLLVLTSWLMVSNVKFFAKIGMGRKFRRVKAFLAAIVAILILFKLQLFLFPVLLSYILFCFVREIILLVNSLDFNHRRNQQCQDTEQDLL